MLKIFAILEMLRPAAQEIVDQWDTEGMRDAVEELVEDLRKNGAGAAAKLIEQLGPMLEIMLDD